jgi:hypothetical protein
MTRHSRPPVQSAAIAAKRLPLNGRTSLPLVLLVLALAVLAAGCGAANDDSVAPQSADAAHEAWIAAVRAGDEDAALALTDPELPQREQFARDEVNRLQEYLTSPASPTGPLENVTVDPVRDGVGRSVWQFAAKRWCYRAELVSRDERWFVSGWGQTSVDCS